MSQVLLQVKRAISKLFCKKVIISGKKVEKIVENSKKFVFKSNSDYWELLFKVKNHYYRLILDFPSNLNFEDLDKNHYLFKLEEFSVKDINPSDLALFHVDLKMSNLFLTYELLSSSFIYYSDNQINYNIPTKIENSYHNYIYTSTGGSYVFKGISNQKIKDLRAGHDKRYSGYPDLFMKELTENKLTNKFHRTPLKDFYINALKEEVEGLDNFINIRDYSKQDIHKYISSLHKMSLDTSIKAFTNKIFKTSTANHDYLEVVQDFMMKNKSINYDDLKYNSICTLYQYSLGKEYKPADYSLILLNKSDVDIKVFLNNISMYYYITNKNYKALVLEYVFGKIELIVDDITSMDLLFQLLLFDLLVNKNNNANSRKSLDEETIIERRNDIFIYMLVKNRSFINFEVTDSLYKASFKLNGNKYAYILEDFNFNPEDMKCMLPDIRSNSFFKKISYVKEDDEYSKNTDVYLALKSIYALNNDFVLKDKPSTTFSIKHNYSINIAATRLYKDFILENNYPFIRLLNNISDQAKISTQDYQIIIREYLNDEHYFRNNRIFEDFKEDFKEVDIIKRGG